MLPHHSHLKSSSFWDCQQKNGAIPTESITENITIQIFCAKCMHSSPGPSAFSWSKALAQLISNCSPVLLTCKLFWPPQSSGFSSQIDRHHTLSFKIELLDEKGCCFINTEIIIPNNTQVKCFNIKRHK